MVRAKPHCLSDALRGHPIHLSAFMWWSCSGPASKCSRVARVADDDDPSDWSGIELEQMEPAVDPSSGPVGLEPTIFGLKERPRSAWKACDRPFRPWLVDAG